MFSQVLTKTRRQWVPLIIGAVLLTGVLAWAGISHARNTAAKPVADAAAAEGEKSCCRTGTSRAQILQSAVQSKPATPKL